MCARLCYVLAVSESHSHASRRRATASDETSQVCPVLCSTYNFYYYYRQNACVQSHDIPSVCRVAFNSVLVLVLGTLLLTHFRAAAADAGCC